MLRGLYGESRIWQELFPVGFVRKFSYRYYRNLQKYLSTFLYMYISFDYFTFLECTQDWFEFGEQTLYENAYKKWTFYFLSESRALCRILTRLARCLVVPLSRSTVHKRSVKSGEVSGNVRTPTRAVHFGYIAKWRFCPLTVSKVKWSNSTGQRVMLHYVLKPPPGYVLWKPFHSISP